MNRERTKPETAQAEASLIPEEYLLQPIEYSLMERSDRLLAEGARHLKATLHPEHLKRLRRLSESPYPKARQIARSKLFLIEKFFRKKFYFYQQKLSRSPSDPAVKYGFALICLRYAQFWTPNARLREYFLRQSLRQLNQLIRLFRPEKKFFYLRAQVLKEMGQCTLAIEDFQKVLRMEPKHRGAILGMIECYFMTHRPREGLLVLKQLRSRKQSLPGIAGSFLPE